MHQAVNPAGWPRPKGYANGIVATGRFLAIAGQIGWDENEELVGADFMSQFHKALSNVAAILEAAEGGPEHLISLTIYVTDKTEYATDLKAVGGIYRDILGKNFPTMALVQVADLLEPGAKVEIQGLAVLPA